MDGMLEMQDHIGKCRGHAEQQKAPPIHGSSMSWAQTWRLTHKGTTLNQEPKQLDHTQITMHRESFRPGML